VATSVNLRCYAILSPRSDDKVALEVPNLSFEGEWEISTLPWNLLPFGSDRAKREAGKELETPLLSAIEEVVTRSETGRTGINAGVAFLYLYMVMAGSEANSLIESLFFGGALAYVS
jgi:hypothetical protein